MCSGHDAFSHNASNEGPRRHSRRQADQRGHKVDRKGVPKCVTKRCPKVCNETVGNGIQSFGWSDQNTGKSHF